MPKKGTADLPLHYGKVPRWLFQRMALLAREVSLAVVTEFGVQEISCDLRPLHRNAAHRHPPGQAGATRQAESVQETITMGEASSE
jgi:hypothetical protein